MTKKYIDKKNALHFRLVQKSVREECGEREREFAPMDEKTAAKMVEMQREEEYVEDSTLDIEDLDNVADLSHPVEKNNWEAGEAAKYGIYYDDRSYDYTKHLKPIGLVPDAVFIPSTCNVETVIDEEEDDDEQEEEDCEDPAVKEVLDALDDEAFEDGDFDDDFVVKLNRDETAILCPVNHNRTYRDKDDDNVSYYSDDDSSSCGGISYAASLAITSIDKKFDAIMKIYDDEDELDDITLDEDEEEDSDAEETAINEAIEEFLTLQNEYIRPSVSERKQGAVSLLDDLRKEMGPLTAEILDREFSEEDLDGEEDIISSDNDHFDCESIPITLMNNLPNVIREKKPPTLVRLSRKTGLPIEESFRTIHHPLTESEPFSSDPKLNKGQSRSKDETVEEKRARKSAIKTERREARAAKKETKVRFKLDKVTSNK